MDVYASSVRTQYGIVWQIVPRFGGVDMSNRMVAHYSHSAKSRKCYHSIALQFSSEAVLDSWIVFNQRNIRMSLLEFPTCPECTNDLPLPLSGRKCRIYFPFVLTIKKTPLKRLIFVNI